MARGGKRKGASGTAYAQRTDLNAPAPNFDGGYGDDKANKMTGGGRRGVDMQQVRATAEGAQAARAATPNPQVARPIPRQVTPLDAPDDRPSEPVTAGLNIGPGPNGGLGIPDPRNETLALLYELHRRFPHPDILDLILFEEDRV